MLFVSLLAAKALADPSSAITILINTFSDSSCSALSLTGTTTQGPSSWVGQGYYGDCTSDIIQSSMSVIDGTSVRHNFEYDGMSQWAQCFKSLNSGEWRSVYCTDTAGHKNPKKDLGTCQPCVSNPASTDTSTVCSSINTQTLCEGPTDSLDAHSCWWYGDSDGNYGPGCSDYEQNCSPCTVGNWDNTNAPDAICNPLKNLNDCSDATGMDGNTCMWMGWGMGRNCNAISPIIGEWYSAVWFIVVLILVILTCMSCLIIYCCCAASFGAAMCCVKATTGNNDQNGRVNNQAYARMGGTNGQFQP